MSANSGLAWAPSLELARDLLSFLEVAEKPLGERLVALVGDYVRGEVAGESGILDFRREVNRLIEFLARRDAKAMPLAALGRGILAELSGDAREAERLQSEFENKVRMLGLF